MICRKCEVDKVVEEFTKGHKTCKACKRAYANARYRSNPEVARRSLEAARRRRKSPEYGDKMRAYARIRRISKLDSEGQARVHRFREAKQFDDCRRFLKEVLSNTHSVAKRRAIQVSLSLDDVKGLWDKQNGKCFYSGLPLDLFSPSRAVVSIDRVDSNKSYTVDNVVLCCGVINRMKLDMVVGDFVELCRLVGHPHIGRPDPGPIGRICKVCGQVKDLSEFFRGTSSCYLCLGRVRKLDMPRRYDDPLAHFLNNVVLENARAGAKVRSIPFSITTEGLLELWHKQAGRCYYSGLPMATVTPDRRIVSVDRVDSEGGYAPGNVVLSCSAINRMKLELSVADFRAYCKSVVTHTDAIGRRAATWTVTKSGHVSTVDVREG